MFVGRLREEDIGLVEEMRYHLDKMLSRSPDNILRLTQVRFLPIFPGTYMYLKIFNAGFSVGLVPKNLDF